MKITESLLRVAAEVIANPTPLHSSRGSFIVPIDESVAEIKAHMKAGGFKSTGAEQHNREIGLPTKIWYKGGSDIADHLRKLDPSAKTTEFNETHGNHKGTKFRFDHNSSCLTMVRSAASKNKMERGIDEAKAGDGMDASHPSRRLPAPTKTILVKKDSGRGHDRLIVGTRPDGTHYTVAKSDDGEPSSPSGHGADLSLSNFTATRQGEGTAEARIRLHQALVNAHKTGDKKKVAQVMKDHGYNHHDWKLHEEAELEEGEEASSYARTTSPYIRDANLRNAQNMANALGKPVTTSDGRTAHPEKKKTTVKEEEVEEAFRCPGEQIAHHLEQFRKADVAHHQHTKAALRATDPVLRAQADSSVKNAEAVLAHHGKALEKLYATHGVTEDTDDDELGEGLGHIAGAAYIGRKVSQNYIDSAKSDTRHVSSTKPEKDDIVDKLMTKFSNWQNGSKKKIKEDTDEELGEADRTSIYVTPDHVSPTVAWSRSPMKRHAAAKRITADKMERRKGEAEARASIVAQIKAYADSKRIKEGTEAQDTKPYHIVPTQNRLGNVSFIIKNRHDWKDQTIHDHGSDEGAAVAHVADLNVAHCKKHNLTEVEAK